MEKTTPDKSKIAEICDRLWVSGKIPAINLDMLKQRNIMTPDFQVFQTGREKISPTLRFPLIVKPIAEGSSKGIAGKKSVVDDIPSLRKVVDELIKLYRQPALVEEYITGREFTVGLLGERRPRILPPMEAGRQARTLDLSDEDRELLRAFKDFRLVVNGLYRPLPNPWARAGVDARPALAPVPERRLLQRLLARWSAGG